MSCNLVIKDMINSYWQSVNNIYYFHKTLHFVELKSLIVYNFHINIYWEWELYE